MSRWLAEGKTLGRSLGHFHGIVVSGGDPDATADVALGIAEAQSLERRVIIGDLLGNHRRLGGLLADDDPHGLVDAFDYGISLGRIARPIGGNPNLQVAPTGSMTPDYAVLLPHPRWARIFATFRQAGHLLVLVVPIGAPAAAELVNQLDGLVLVDSLAPARVEEGKILSNVVLAPQPLPRLSQVVAAQPEPIAPKPKPPARRPVNPTIRPSVVATQPIRRQTTVMQAFAKPAGYGAGLSILGALVLYWLVNLVNQSRDQDSRPSLPGPLQRVAGASAPTEAVKAPDPNQVNPADSGAAVYAVRMMSANTMRSAILKLQEYGTSMPAATFAPVEKSGQPWFEVLTGAYTTRGGADSLLTSLRAAGRLDAISPGVVVRVPYTVLIDSVPTSATINDLLASLRTGRQLPVYALQQRNGWLWIVAGAFETRSQAEAYRETIRARDPRAEVVLRKGRMF